MKDFAKSIRTGNSYTKGQVLGEEEGKKYVFCGEINGTYIVHRQPDGKTFSFSSEQEIKDWMRNSKIGNSKVGNSVPENLHERFGYRLAVTKDGEGKKETISELEMAISDYKIEISEKEKELSKDKQNLQKLEAVLRKYK